MHHRSINPPSVYPITQLPTYPPTRHLPLHPIIHPTNPPTHPTIHSPIYPSFGPSTLPSERPKNNISVCICSSIRSTFSHCPLIHPTDYPSIHSSFQRRSL